MSTFKHDVNRIPLFHTLNTKGHSGSEKKHIQILNKFLFP